MIDPKHEVSITRQAELLGISRAAVYYVPRPISEADLALQRRIDELHLEYPFAGARTLRDLLEQEGIYAGRKHIGTLMARMGIEALVRRKSTSRRAPGHEIYPYLLRNVAIERSNHVWALDITYIPMRRGIVYTDQGCQFTCSEFIVMLKSHEIAISMDGKGCWRDNVFIERFWKTLKYQEVYLRAYETVSEARASIARYIAFYNSRRPHRAHQGRTPDEAYFAALPMKQAA